MAARAKDPVRGNSTTRPSPLLRLSITIRNAGDGVENTPGFLEGDAFAHCGPTLEGEFCWTVNLTCMRTGWVTTNSTRNNAHLDVFAAVQDASTRPRSGSAGPTARTGVPEVYQGSWYTSWPDIFIQPQATRTVRPRAHLRANRNVALAGCSASRLPRRPRRWRLRSS